MEKNLVSIVIPIYNVEKYLDACLTSVARQTYRPLEVILVDDGSVDGSAGIATRYVREYSFFSLYTRENGGLSAARNTGMEHATGKYIYFLDSDDYLEETAIETLVNEATEKNADVVKFQAFEFTDGQEEVEQKGYVYQGNYSGSYPGQAFLREQAKTTDATMCSCCLIFLERELLEKHNLRFPEKILHEDNLFHFRVLFYARSVVVLKKCLYYRRYRTDSITRSDDNLRRRFAGYMECLLGMDKFIEENEVFSYADYSPYAENLLHGAKTCFLASPSAALSEKEKEYFRVGRKMISRYRIPKSFPYRLFYTFPRFYWSGYHRRHAKS
ncbi:MAG: glycosyltransferase family 2 protein [Lachnospiraceae bacterium]